MKVKFTELNSGYEGERKVSRFSKKAKAKIVIASALVVAFFLVFILSLIGIIPLDALFLRMRVAFSGEDKNFPLEINTESTVFLGKMDDSTIVLTTENIIVYKEKGKESYSMPHIYSKPGISVNGDRAVVFDRGGTTFMLLNEKEVVYEGEATNNILCAYYSDNGSYALGTLGDKTTGSVSVYNKKHEQIFKWNCSKEYISSVTVSDNGDYVGVSVVGAENGAIFTTVQFFGIDYKEPLASQKISDAVPLSIAFTENGILTVVTDIGVYSIDKESGTLTSNLTYYSSEFTCCDISDKGNALVTIAKYGSKNVFEVVLFSSSGEIELTVPVDREVKSAYVTDKYIVILADGQILVYNFRGKLVSTVDYKGEPISLLPTDDFIYIESLDKIYRCFTYGDSSVTLNS